MSVVELAPAVLPQLREGEREGGPDINLPPPAAYVCVEDGESRSSAHCRVVQIVWSGPSYWLLWASLEKRATPTNQNEEKDTTLYCAELLL